jgi:hypothetical protein
MSSVSAVAHAMEAVLEGKSPRDRAEPDRPAGWVIWPGPSRGYIALESDLPSLADALEALWFLRGEALDLLTKSRNPPSDQRRDQGPAQG